MVVCGVFLNQDKNSFFVNACRLPIVFVVTHHHDDDDNDFPIE